MKTNLRIGEVLMERGYITSDQMDKALGYGEWCESDRL